MEEISKTVACRHASEMKRRHFDVTHWYSITVRDVIALPCATSMRSSVRLICDETIVTFDKPGSTNTHFFYGELRNVCNYFFQVY